MSDRSDEGHTMSDQHDEEARHDSAEEHGDSAKEFEEGHDVTNPSNEPAESQIDRLLGGHEPIR